MTEERTLFKHFYDETLVRTLADKLQPHASGWDAARFVQLASRQLDALEMKARVRQIAAAWHDTLPGPYPAQLDALLSQLDGEALSIDDGSGMFNRGFHLMPLAQFVEEYGIGHFDASLQALYHITQYFTGEFAIRPFILHDRPAVWKYLLRWREDANHHVRRLVSEGTRPRLPWGMRLQPFVADPTPLFDLLYPLRHDESDYVRRSVANNLNDITKDHPQQVTARLADWHRDGSSPRLDAVTRHGLRSLVKHGDVAALKLLGYDAPSVEVAGLIVTPHTVTIGDTIQFSFRLHNTSETAQRLVVDYRIHLMRANGSHNIKVFKLKKLYLTASEMVSITKSHSFRRITTRRYYAGPHRLELQINGVVLASADFSLVDAD